ncbi:hypothetical protein CCH79_00010650 [Gambusia affinis]|uniref:CIDE-N domain-containing protein n=1 Tax=Gambusia affinis TaxID=33528 RepID=A0A315W5I4_GAMAF|nr:hypothetical protein CCH79_00010650 [Gambusia affinis]
MPGRTLKRCCRSDANATIKAPDCTQVQSCPSGLCGGRGCGVAPPELGPFATKESPCRVPGPSDLGELPFLVCISTKPPLFSQLTQMKFFLLTSASLGRAVPSCPEGRPDCKDKQRCYDGRPCKVFNFTRQKSYGVVVSSLDDLKKKGCECLGVSPSGPVTVVLESDGTIVEDQAYFLCLPFNTKFMLLHDKETWAPARKIDGGTAWMARESVVLEADVVDSNIIEAPWWKLALQLKQDLTSIILMCWIVQAGTVFIRSYFHINVTFKEKFVFLSQSLVQAPCSELASALGFQEKKTEDLQVTLQSVLDRREEERQSKELLQLYLKAVENEDRQQGATSPSSQDGAGDEDMLDGLEVDSASEFMSRTLMVLKGKTSPETRLSTEDLQAVVSRGLEAMQQVLGWDTGRTAALLQACEAELSTRLQQIQAMQSISGTQQDGSKHGEGAGTATQGSS